MARSGDTSALETLIARHQGWLFNLALRMLQVREDAEDAAQEILVKIATHLSGFRGDSAFRTWAYRIAVNHLLERRRSRAEAVVHGFVCYSDYLARASSTPLDPEWAVSPEQAAILLEAKRACLMGMLLCLDRSQRLVFIVGAMFGIKDKPGAEIMGISRANFRQKLSRARHQLGEFIAGNCGLIDPQNACRCAHKTQAFIRDGIVDPAHLVFVEPEREWARQTSSAGLTQFEDAIAAGIAELYRDIPLRASPDLIGRLRDILAGDGLNALVGSPFP